MSRASVTARVSSLLDAFDDEHAELSLAELSRRAGMPKSTVHRLAGELSSAGLLERSGSSWQLGFRLFELGHMVTRPTSLSRVAKPILKDLQATVSQTVHLAVLDGSEVVYIDILMASHDRALPSRVGGRLPATSTGVGKALLAFSPKDVVGHAMAVGLPRRTPHSITMPGMFLQELGRTWERRLAVDRQETVPGIACVAAPVLDSDGRAISAISVTGLAQRINVERIGPLVSRASRQISRGLAGERASLFACEGLVGA